MFLLLFLANLRNYIALYKIELLFFLLLLVLYLLHFPYILLLLSYMYHKIYLVNNRMQI